MNLASVTRLERGDMVFNCANGVARSSYPTVTSRSMSPGRRGPQLFGSPISGIRILETIGIVHTHLSRLPMPDRSENPILQSIGRDGAGWIESGDPQSCVGVHRSAEPLAVQSGLATRDGHARCRVVVCAVGRRGDRRPGAARPAAAAIADLDVRAAGGSSSVGVVTRVSNSACVCPWMKRPAGLVMCRATKST